jgi:eukaryotic-like serine/threonine-protein kinase
LSLLLRLTGLLPVNNPSAHVVRRQLLAGRYDLESHVGSGGAGTVWRAHDRLLDRTVAIKLLHAKVDQTSIDAARFRIEASMAAKLTHPNAVILYDIGRDGDYDYLVMEFVAGGTLAEVLLDGPMTPSVVADLGAQIGRALGVAHQRRMVHRDVKPANVLLTTEGVAKVADFGLARALGAVNARLTLPGHVMGTARYLAPEQLQGESVDARADVYALGVVLHEALTGEIPFGEGTTAEVAHRRLVASLPPVSERRPEVPAALDAAIARATRLEPSERFADGGEFAAELSRSSTMDALRTWMARFAEEPSHDDAPGGRPEEDEPANVTADLPVPGFSSLDSASSLDQPTVDMVAPPVAGVDRGDAGTTNALSGPIPEPVSHERDDVPPDARASARTGDRRPARWPVLTPWLLLVTLVGVGTAVAVFERTADDGIAAVEGAADREVLSPGGGVVDDPEMDPDEAETDVDAHGEADVDRAAADEEGDAVDGAAASEAAEPGEMSFVEVVGARDHDPFGSGEEHRAEVANAYDGDPTTAWQTQGYQGDPALGGLKSGVGIWLDLGQVKQVTAVDVTMTAPGASFTLYAGSRPPDPGEDPDDWGEVVAEVDDAGKRSDVMLDQPAEARVWLLWFTALPPDGPGFRASVSDVRLLSS